MQYLTSLAQHNLSILNPSYMASLTSEVENVSPLDQFEIRDLLSFDVSFFNFHLALTNIGFYLIVGAFLVITLNLLATNYNRAL